jgi:hypothetical protein
VTTEATQADGGDIVLRVHDMIRLQGSQMTAEVGGGRTTVGGNITANAEFVILERSQMIANAFEGRGGNITVTAEVFLTDPAPASQVSASSTLGISGTVDIQAPVTNLSGLVTPLPPDFAPATALLRDQCAARLWAGNVSTLVERRRARMPATPEGILPGRLYIPQARATTPAQAERTQHAAWKAPHGTWQYDGQGQLHLSNWPTSAAVPLTQRLDCGPR